MKASTIATLAIVAAVVIFGLIGAGVCVGWHNTEIELRNQYEAQVDANKAIYDEVWKVIKQKAQITDKYADDFKEIYAGLMEQRYQGEAKGAPMFKFIREQNPQFSTDMYKDLSDAISAQRAKFTMVQLRLRDIKREHDNLRLRFPSALVVGSRPELEVVLVTSKKTKQTFETGEENEVDLF